MDASAWVAAPAAIAAAGAGMAYAVRGRSSAVFGPSVYHGDRGRRSLALTFDDGPSESTPALLELLRRFDVRATFFMCGINVARLPGIAKAVIEAGHEIGNHSDTHPRFDFKSRDVVHRELAEAQRKITGATGVSPKLFRAPYGVRWFGMRAAQERLDLLGVMWTVMGRDWRLPGPEVSERVIRHADAGGIICLHDGRGVQPKPDIGATLAAVADTVPRLKDAGFRFETVSEILRPS